MDEELLEPDLSTEQDPDAEPDFGEGEPEQEVDEEGNPIEAAPEPEPEPEPEPTQYRPPSSAPSDRLSRLKEALEPDIFADLVGLMQETAQAAAQSVAYGSVQVAQAQQQMPQLMRVHGAAIQGYVSELPPEVQRSENAVPAALARLVYEQMSASKDPAATFNALAKLAGNTPAGRAAKAKEVLAPPPSQRVPSGSASPSAGRAPNTAYDRMVKSLMDEGFSRAEAKEQLENERRR